MPQHFDPRAMLKQSSIPLLHQLFQRRGELQELPWEEMREQRQFDLIYHGWQALPDAQRRQVQAIFQDLWELADERGICAIADALNAHAPHRVWEFTACHTHLNKAIWFYARQSFSAPQRLLLLDTWQRSGLPAKDFADLVGLSKHTLYKWKQLFEQRGPEGLMDQPRGARTGSRLSEVTRRTILMLKQAHSDWGCQRISDALARGPALAASAAAIARVLRDEGGYKVAAEPTRPHPTKERRFERARPNQLWQTDLFSFVLKRQNRRLYLVAFLDDHSRFVVSYGLHASSSTALVIEALEAGLANYGVPEEILTDNGPQYVTWRGKSQFTKQLEKRGIRQIVAKPKRPQTLGKIERFWGTLWRELLSGAVFVDLADARQRIGWFIDYYNFLRTHSGIDGLVPADRFFGVGSQLLQTLQARLASNSLELARHGQPKNPFYLTGQVSGQAFSVHAQGERLLLTREGSPQQEIELAAPSPEDPAASSAAEPICPHGAPESWPDEPAEAAPPAPGDEPVIDRLRDELRQEPGDTDESEVL